ncbi:cold-shock protein [Corynebacterium pelargi]|uniref:Cold shock protein CspA n=1 Tax=Corynebacterium pelargi TaxID=1471400 RepID=A0A410WA89_9CORY|nr:cold shock domain-containing protein [Corynebacterium pelargi]QAU52836.1 Cold shock protein CspA [Corynebacterium pelargi]GGG79085.1 cold-shock protein [Corynebacterium pelargi]
MPIGTVRWYDPERGFGFVSNPGEEDVFVSQSVLPQGVENLHKGQRVEFDFAAGRRGPQALRIKVLEQPKRDTRTRPKRKPEDLNSLVADLVTTLEQRVMPPLAAGRYPERAEGRQIAKILRALAKDLDA